MKVSVGIVTYNRADLLTRALRSVVEQDTRGAFTFEVVVVDNGSTDDTAQVVEKIADVAPVPVGYFLEEQQGVAQARNRALREAKGEWIAFIDDDERAECNWLWELFEVAANAGADLVGGAVHLDLPDTDLEELGRECRKSSLRERTGWNYGEKTRRFQGRELPGTNNLLISRTVIAALSSFDETLVTGGEDHDFAIRASNAGFSMWWAPRAVVYHDVPAVRLTPEYFRVDALQGGVQLAYLHLKYGSAARVVFTSIARIGHTVLRTLPLLGLAWVRNDRREALDQNIRLWRSLGYWLRAIALLAPWLLSETELLRQLDFRGSRLLAGTSPAAEDSR